MITTMLLFAAITAADAKLDACRSAVSLCAAKDAAGLHRRFNAQMASALPVSKLREVFGSLFDAAPLGARIEDKGSDIPGGYAYQAVHRWGAQRLAVTVALDGQSRISGLFFKPVTETGGPPKDPKAGYITKTTLSLPFTGSWTVFWGGTTREQNYHVDYADQRHAYDLLAVVDGRTHRGDGKKNEDYHCFNRPILAPADALVVKAEDGIADNVPGVMNSVQIYGNHAVLDFGNGEYALMCHFRKGTLKVKKGDRVKRGQEIARCGNSGNSSEPHLHFHLQDKPKLGLGAVGLPAPFTNFKLDGKLVKQAVPVRGQKIETAKS